MWHWSLARHTTGFAPVQVPPWQVSVCVHALLSSHVVPLSALGFEQMPLVVSQTPTTWHWSLAWQTTGFAPEHAPSTQVSVCVHALPSLQVVPFGLGGFEQWPLKVSQTPTLWHWSLAVQLTGLPPTQLPLTQVSVWVHALPSLHVVPSVTGEVEQVPDVASQTYGLWHWSLVGQTTGFPPTQEPPWHWSVRVQALPSLQVVPFGALGFEQAPLAGSQVPTRWH
jgi:hypothetical protein